ncbi:MAG: PD-(D/E)XK nuclease family protein, partial [Acholeplasmataceae bacterium]
ATEYLGALPSIAAEMIDSLPYIDLDRSYEQGPLRKRKDLKEYLVGKGMLSDRFSELEKHRKRTIWISGYPVKDRLFERCLARLSKIFEIKECTDKKYRDPIRSYVFESDEKEVLFLAERIAALIDQEKVRPEAIRIHTKNEDYLPLMEAVFPRFNLRVNSGFSTHLGDLEIARTVTAFEPKDSTTIKEDLYELYDELKRQYAFASQESMKTFNRIIGIINKYLPLGGRLKDYMPVIAHELERTPIETALYQDGILVTDLTKVAIKGEDHVFIIGFNLGETPEVRRDHDDLSDELKRLIGRETTEEAVAQEKDLILSLVDRSPFLTITQKRTSATERFYPSPLIERIGRTIEDSRHEEDFENVRYSRIQDTIDYAKEEVAYRVFNRMSTALSHFHAHEKITRLEPYDNTFVIRDRELVDRLLDPIDHLSYSKLNTYFECPFKFMFTHVIRVDPFEVDGVVLHIGSFFHEVLKSYQGYDPADPYIEDNLRQKLDDYATRNELEWNHTERFYMEHSLTQLVGVISWLKEIDSRSSFRVLSQEEGASYDTLYRHIRAVVGVIDKVMVLDGNPNAVYLVDYKTGRAVYPLEYVHAGLYAQLFFYLLFLFKNRDQDLDVVGFYYQKIYSKVLNAKEGLDYDTLLKRDWALSGYSSIDHDLVERIDTEWKQKKTLAKYATKNDGTPTKNSWVFHRNDLISALKRFEALIDETIERIEQGSFPIEPKILDGDFSKKVSCQFCSLKDICYVQDKDFISVEKRSPFTSDAKGEDDEDA